MTIKELKAQLAEEQTKMKQELIDKLQPVFKNSSIIVEIGGDFEKVEVTINNRNAPTKEKITTTKLLFAITPREGQDLNIFTSDSTSLLIDGSNRVLGTFNETVSIEFLVIQFAFGAIAEFITRHTEVVEDEDDSKEDVPSS